MTRRELQISMSVELESGKGWPWVMDVDFCGKHFAMSGQFQLTEHSERLNPCPFVNLLSEGKIVDRKLVLL